MKRAAFSLVFFFFHCKNSWDETIGDYYYFNSDTGDTQWAHPLDQIYKQKVSIAREQFNNSKENVTDSNTVGGDTNNLKMDKPPLKLVGAVPSLGQVTILTIEGY